MLIGTDHLIETASFIGLMLGFLGSIFLSIGLLKSKEAIRDEETTYWGYNPFKINSMISDRVAALIGFALIIAGFSTSASAALVQVIPMNISYNLIVTSLALTFIGWLVILLVLQRRSATHTKAKMAHERMAVSERFKLQVKDINNIIDSQSRDSYDLNTVRFQNLEVLIHHLPDLSVEDRGILNKTLEEIKASKDFEQLKTALEKGSHSFFAQITQ